MWQPACKLEQLKARAELYALVRDFFARRQVLEVETPLISRASATDPMLDSVSLNLSAGDAVGPRPFYLNTSPEFPMKRLLAAGSGPIYQICKSFRDGENGRRHNPEFTMLEWYRPGFDLEQLMDEVEQLVLGVLQCSPATRRSYRNAFVEITGIDPFSVSDAALSDLARERAAYNGPVLSRDENLDLLLSVLIEPELGKQGPEFVYHYPASQAALAKVGETADGYAIAERFELYIEGLEIANGYFELTDAREQHKRFKEDNQQRVKLGKPEITIDRFLLDALAAGMPSSAGVALGLDRLLMLRSKLSRIQDVLAFPIERS